MTGQIASEVARSRGFPDRSFLDPFDPGFVLSTSVPEPSPVVLLVLGGLGAVVGFSRRKPRITSEN
jgi:hypothetical protein